tara:strand:+ start:210 stop:623 length:414 start_codon:yes stop_codon:yes gene_type:complete
MSEQRSHKAARLHCELSTLKSRRDALKCVYESISGDAFTDSERDLIDRHFRECEAEILEKELAIAHHADFVQTTLSKCVSDVSTRAKTLNELFSQDVMRDHQEMMTYFVAHQTFLKSMTSDSHNDHGDSGSELDGDE